MKRSHVISVEHEKKNVTYRQTGLLTDRQKMIQREAWPLKKTRWKHGGSSSHSNSEF